jgi:hypothetical protein
MLCEIGFRLRMNMVFQMQLATHRRRVAHPPLYGRFGSGASPPLAFEAQTKMTLASP